MNESFLNATQIPMRYLKIVFRRKWYFIVPIVVGLIGGIVTGAVLPKVYESSSVVMVEEEKTLNPLISGLAISSDISSRMRTIREQILGWNSLVQLVDRLNLAKNVKSQLEYEKLILGLRNKIEVRMKGPDLIKISYASSDPQEAKKVVQTVNDIFVEENMKSQEKESSIAINFLKDQIKVYSRKIKEAEISDMKDKLSNLLIDSTDEHPMVKDLRMQIDQAQKELETATFDVENAKPIPNANPIYETLVKEKLETVTQQLEAGGTSTAGLTPLDKVNPVKTGSDEELYKLLLLDKMDATMARDAKVNESIYNMLLQRLETAKITQRLEASKQGTRYTVLDPPRLPLKPVRPNKTLVAFIGVFLGGCAGIGLILLLEFTDHSLLGLDEAKEFLELPVLGGISRILTEEDIAVTRERSRFRTMIFVVVSVLLIVVTSLYSFLQKP
ncbi:MAG: GNVR domain-containing protein [Candidatus Omnitrophica bacterium]|nr:GNVR domain-containing protein [Candidatus Omnitrophota bacterium]MDD5574781.1 GNVR domain-containing protein [Candidatus Omnitrophota bacterium]